MATNFPDAFPTPFPGQPSGPGTFVPGHPYATNGPFEGHATLADDLVSYWALDEESGTRYDSVGSNDLTDINTVGFSTVTGPPNFPVGKAASFVAANSECLKAVDHDSLDLTGDYTLSIWVYLPNLGNYRGFISKNTFSDAYGYDIHSVSGTGAFRGFHGTGEVNGGPPVISTGAWTQVMRVFTGGTATHYINTVQSAATPALGNLPAQTQSLYVGALNWSGDSPSYFMDGMLAHAAIWSRALTAQERTDLYNSGDGLFY